MRVRFAPTPSGPLLVNGARVALANYLFARRYNAPLLIRLDDVDTERCPPAISEQLTQDLRWLGIDWDSCIHQSERRPLYDAAIARLQAQQLLYPCFESEEELRAKQEMRRKRNQPLVYDRAMLALTPAQRAAAEAGGKRPYWRLRLSPRELRWHDGLLGERHAKLPAISDPVLVRADGTPMPLLASVVDDIDTGITHIIRGEENAANTAIQIELFERLTGRPMSVAFAHLPPLPDGARALPGRRVAGLPIRQLRSDGIEPAAITVCMAGTNDPRRAPKPLADLIASFDLERYAKADFSVACVLAANRRALAGLGFAEVADRLPPGATERFWLAVRGNLDMLKEARGWWDVVTGTIVPPVVENEHDLLTLAAELLPAEPWGDAVWEQWVDAIVEATGRSRAGVLAPLYLALTGEDAGPGLADLLPLLGRARALERLRIAAA
ncbi:MAG: glutamate--tRNA ligase family protein [Acetobacteraceae bacterium]|nr:glutamate--tRNA ligase [Pseudomonadota bacterium]